MKERWLAIPGYEGWYEVSDAGRVRRVRPAHNSHVGKIIAGGSNPVGYRIMRLCRLGVIRGFTTHALVMLAFVGPRPDGAQVNHKDGNKKNNRLSNLEYVTPAENIAHAKRNGLMRAGENHPMYGRRKAACAKGHPYDEKNTYIQSKGGRIARVCRACRAAIMRNRTARLRGAAS